MNAAQRIAANEARIAEIEAELAKRASQPKGVTWDAEACDAAQHFEKPAQARTLPRWPLQPLSKRAQDTFDRIVALLDYQGSPTMKLDSGRGYMALHVERLSPGVYSLAHYYKQNGDTCSDPDGVFYQPFDGGPVYPVELTQHPVGRYTRAVEIGHGMKVEGYKPRAYRDLCSFAAMWLGNIAAQQNLRARKLAA